MLRHLVGGGDEIPLEGTTGNLFVIIFMMISGVIAINILVAIIVNSYMEIHGHIDFHYNKDLLDICYKYGRASNMTSLTATQFPFNIPGLIGAFCMCRRNKFSHKINDWVLKIQYWFPIIPCLFILYFMALAILIPLVYIKLVI